MLDTDRKADDRQIHDRGSNHISTLTSQLSKSYCYGQRQVHRHLKKMCQLHYTCIFPKVPVLSIRLAIFTVFPHISYCGFLAPITPATTGP